MRAGKKAGSERAREQEGRDQGSRVWTRLRRGPDFSKNCGRDFVGLKPHAPSVW